MPTPTTAQAAPSVLRPLRSPTEHTTAVMQDVSGCLNQLAELYRQLWSVAVANAEAQLTIAIDVQTAALNPGLAVFDATATAARRSVESSSEAAHRSQPMVFDGFQATVELLERLVPDAVRAGTR